MENKNKLTLVTNDGDFTEYFFEKLPEVGDVIVFKGKFFKIRQFHWHCPETDEQVDDAKSAIYCASIDEIGGQKQTSEKKVLND